MTGKLGSFLIVIPICNGGFSRRPPATKVAGTFEPAKHITHRAGLVIFMNALPDFLYRRLQPPLYKRL